MTNSCAICTGPASRLLTEEVATIFQQEMSWVFKVY